MCAGVYIHTYITEYQSGEHFQKRTWWPARTLVCEYFHVCMYFVACVYLHVCELLFVSTSNSHTHIKQAAAFNSQRYHHSSTNMAHSTPQTYLVSYRQAKPAALCVETVRNSLDLFGTDGIQPESLILASVALFESGLAPARWAKCHLGGNLGKNHAVYLAHCINGDI